MVNISTALKNFSKAPLESTFKFLGDNPNGAIWVACTIALFKGIFRPIFTLRDKKSDPETKKYTAMREFLTEMIAIPVYYAIPKFGSKLVINNFFKNETKVAQKAVEANVKFLGVLASTAIIPAVCNLIQPSIMKSYTNYVNKKSKTAIAQDNPVTSVETTNKPSFSGNNPLPMKNLRRVNYGMRVGS